MCKTLGYVFLVFGVGRLLECGIKPIVVILKYLKDSIFLILTTAIIIDGVIKDGGNIVLRIMLVAA